MCTVLYFVVCVQCCTLLYVYSVVLCCMCTVLYFVVCVQCCTLLYVYSVVLCCMCTVLYFVVCVQCCTLLCVYSVVLCCMCTVLYFVVCVQCCTLLYVYSAVLCCMCTVLYFVVCAQCCTLLFVYSAVQGSHSFSSPCITWWGLVHVRHWHGFRCLLVNYCSPITSLFLGLYIPWCRREKSRVCSADDGYNLISQKQCCTGIPLFSLLLALHGETSSSSYTSDSTMLN